MPKFAPKFAVIRFLVGVLTIPVWAGCTQQPASNNSSSATAPLVSGNNPWPGYAGHYVALKQDLFGKEGVTVKEAYFQSATETITAFLAHKTDVSWVTSGDAIQIIEKEPSAKIIYLVDYSNGSDGILGRNITSPSDLKGKTVGRENLLFENVLLRAYLAKGKLTEKDIVIKDMTAADAATAFASKKVDAAVSYEPWLTKAARQGNGKVIFSTKGTNLIADVIVAHKNTIENRRPALLSYIRAIDKGVKLVNANDPEALKITADKLGVKVDEAKEQLSGVKIFDLKGNQTIGFNLKNPNNMMKNLELTVNTAVATKVIPKAIAIQALYDDSLVNSLK